VSGEEKGKKKPKLGSKKGSHRQRNFSAEETAAGFGPSYRNTKEEIGDASFSLGGEKKEKPPTHTALCCDLPGVVSKGKKEVIRASHQKGGKLKQKGKKRKKKTII